MEVWLKLREGFRNYVWLIHHIISILLEIVLVREKIDFAKIRQIFFNNISLH